MQRREIELDELEALEQLVDKYGLISVIEGLENICYLKSAHVAEAWQDEYLAKAWERLGKLFDRWTESKRLKRGSQEIGW
jgi:hypothetical protein